MGARPVKRPGIPIDVVWDALVLEWANSGRLGKVVAVDISPVIRHPFFKNVD